MSAGLNGDEGIAVSQWFMETLGGDSTLQGLTPGGFHDGAAEVYSAYPIVRWSPQSPGLVNRVVGTAEVLLNQLWLVLAVIEGTDFEPLRPLARRIHTLLHGSLNVPLSTGTLNTCVREEAFQRSVTTGGREYRHLGGIYRTYVEP